MWWARIKGVAAVFKPFVVGVAAWAPLGLIAAACVLLVWWGLGEVRQHRADQKVVGQVTAVVAPSQATESGAIQQENENAGKRITEAGGRAQKAASAIRSGGDTDAVFFNGVCQYSFYDGDPNCGGPSGGKRKGGVAK